MESQPHNPEFRNNPENFHPCPYTCIQQDKDKSFSVNPLAVYLIETPFNTFENRADPDQAILVRAAWSGFSLFANGNIDD